MKPIKSIIIHMNLNLPLNLKMKKILVSYIIFVLLVGIVSASAFSTIGMQGLSFVSPEIAEVVNLAICVSSPILCLEGKIIGQVQGEVFQSIAEASPEAAKSIITYNQIKGYVDLGAEITSELQVDETGEITEGMMSFQGTESHIGKQLGFEDPNDVFVKNLDVEFNKEEGFNQINFNEEGVLWINQNGQQTNFQDIKEQSEDTNAFIKLDEEGNIIETDFTTTAEGGSYTIGNDFINVPPNSRVLFKDGLIEINVLNSEECEYGVKGCSAGIQRTNFKLPSLVDASKNSNIIEVKGNGMDIVLVDIENSPLLNDGTLAFKNGQIYVPEGKKATIDSIIISDGGIFSSDINLYFDGLKHLEGGTYVSMNSNTGKLIAEVESFASTKDFKVINIQPLEGNPIFNIEEDDFLSFKISEDSFLSFKSREDEGLIPEVIITHNTMSSFIENGNNNFILSGQRMLVGSGVNRDDVGKRSIPMEIIAKDVDGNDILGTKDEPQKFIISSYNQFAAVPLDFTGTMEVTENFRKFPLSNFLETEPCSAGVKGCRVRSRLHSFPDPLVNLYNKEVNLVGGRGSEFEGKNPRDFLTEEELRVLDAQMAFIPEEIFEGRTIEIYPDDYWDNVLEKRSDGIAFDWGMRIPVRSINRDDVFYHENIHNWHFTMEGSNWEKAWLKLAGSYGKDGGELVVGTKGHEHNFATWADGSTEPRYGKVGSYGGNNKFEDIATVSPYIIERSLQYSEFINPTSDFYREKIGKRYESGIMDAKMAQEWSDIYLGKLALSMAQGTITSSQYVQIFEGFSKEERSELRKREFEILRSIGYF